MMRTWRHSALLLSALPLACSSAAPSASPDADLPTATRAEILEDIEGFDDPIASWLRQGVREDGTLHGDYEDVLAALEPILECDPVETSSFMVLSNEALAPKSIFTACSRSSTDASRFFLLLPSLRERRDIEPQLIHMTAWDPTAGEYRRYATYPHPEGGMAVDVQPTFCLDCHGGPMGLSTWQPIMNEMTNPWTQWNAEPGFRSHHFDEDLDTNLAGQHVFEGVQSRLDSASNLEPIIRAGIDRVSSARAKKRNNAVQLDEALELLQPLFCDEQVNYVSEIHRSGEIRHSSIVDKNLWFALADLGIEGAEAWLQQPTILLAAPGTGETAIVFAPVRAESTAQAELALLTRGALGATDILQVRALDWKNPVLSEFRCSLYREGRQRIAAAPEAFLGEHETNEDTLTDLLREILTIDTQGERIHLYSEDGIVAIADASTLPEDVSSIVPSLLTSPEGLLETLQAHMQSPTRSSVLQQARERACKAAQIYPTAPLIPGLECE